MISITYKKFGLSINSVWFCDEVKNRKSDIIFFHGVQNNNFQDSLVKQQLTLITDLHESSEAIFKLINKNCRYEINRAEKENIKCEAYKSDILKENAVILKIFKQEYIDFIKLKGISNAYNENAIMEYIDNGNLILTKAFQNNESYAQHIYVCDSKNTRLLYSVSNFRTEGTDRNLIGRANKYLHWYDIQYFKDNQYQTLDWGGVSSFTDLNGVDKFKKEFGGREEKYYNIIQGISLLGKAVVLAKKIKEG